MTAKQIAMRNVIKMLAIAVIVGVGTGILLNTVPLHIIGIGLSIVGLAYLTRMVYVMELDKAERLEKLNRSVDK